MLLERAEVSVKAGSEEAFEKAITGRGVALLAGIPGVKDVSFGRGVENPGKFIFLVEWESMQAHAAFRDHPAHAEFLALFAPHGESGAMEHFEVS